MADTIAKLGRDRSLSTLARRLFVIEGPDTERKLKHAEAALLRANPHLATPEGFVAGRTVIVPGDIGLAPTDRVMRPAKSAGGLLDETGTRLEAAGAALAQRFRSGAEKDEAALGRLGDRTFLQKLRRALPESAGLLRETGETIAGRAENDRARAESFAQAIEDAQAELAGLRALAERQR